jgi:hypothetical protein
MSEHLPAAVIIPAHEHLALNVIGIILYSILALVCLTTFSWRIIKRRRYEQAIHSLRNLRDISYYPIPGQILLVEWLFKIFLLLFLISRIVWLVFILCETPDLDQFIVNRCAFAFFFTAFTLVMFFWAEMVHKNYYESHSFLPKLGLLFVLANVIIWLLQIIGICLVLSKSAALTPTNPFYVVNVLVDAFISITISFGFLIYGLKLTCRKLYVVDGLTPALNSEAVKMILCTVFFAACFLLRGLMYTYWFLTHQFMDDILYIILTYYFSELVPSAIQLFIFHTTKRHTQFNSQFISNLYAIDEKSPLQHPRSYTVSTTDFTPSSTISSSL